jgi:hypothetical protein
MKKISIWAPLRYANVGDDMQAIAFATYIKKMGYDVKLYQLDEELAQLYNLQSVPSVDELCQDVNLVIIAGGALLTPFKWYKRILNKAAREYEADFKELYLATKKYPNVKFCAISMGGDGKVKKPETWYSHWRIDFFRSSAFLDGTVRLSGDVEQMKSAFGKNFIYHADMLFRTPDYFEYDLLPETDKVRVCLQFKKGRYLDKNLLADIYKYAAENDDIEFHFITTHMPKIGLTYQYLPKKASKNIYIDTYKSPRQLLGVLASCDITMTSMLHVGLMGLTVKTPFISYRGPGKTKSFLKSIGGDWAILSDKISFEKLRNQFFIKKKEELFKQYDQHVIAEMIKDSKKQYDFCKSIVEKYV